MALTARVDRQRLTRSERRRQVVQRPKCPVGGRLWVQLTGGRGENTHSTTATTTSAGTSPSR